MRLASIRLHPYSLPLRRAWTAARGVLTVRQGTLVEVIAEGVSGWGDCAPLPSSGEADRQRTLASLAAAARGLAGQTVEQGLGGLAAIAAPQARWAVETALRDLAARRAGVALHRYLGAQPRMALPVNAALGALDKDCAGRAAAAAERGFTVAKIKVGLGPVDDELARLRTVVRETAGRLRLRLDANGAWTPEQAERFLREAAAWPIDGVEEPLAEPTPGRFRRLQQALPFPIAIDESLPELGIEAVLGEACVRRLVVKPARLGSFGQVLGLAERARAAGIELVLTSVVDSAIGVTAAAHLAAALPVPAVHGLATLDWLAQDVAPAPALRDGTLRLPQRPGLGLAPYSLGAQS